MKLDIPALKDVLLLKLDLLEEYEKTKDTAILARLIRLNMADQMLIAMIVPESNKKAWIEAMKDY